VSNSVDLKEFVAGFLLEADEHLHSVNRNLVDTSEALKKGMAEPRAIRELFRSIHTIKGLASMVGAEPIVDISHEMESILRLADRSGGKITESALNLILKGTTAIEERIRVISKLGVEGIPKAPVQLLEALALEQNTSVQTVKPREIELQLPPSISKSLSASDKEQIIQAAQGGRRVVLIEFQPSSERANLGFTITSVRDQLGKLGDLIKVSPQSAPKAPTGISFFMILATESNNAAIELASNVQASEMMDVVLIAKETEVLESVSELAPQSSSEMPEEVSSNDHSSIRVDVRRLDEALERLSELVVTRFKMSRVAANLTEKGVDTRELNAVIADHTRQLKRLRTAITESRMVPLSELLQRIPLVVRGLTKDSGKTVNVVIKASSAEVDKAVADKIFPAVVHLVRNAVDHAIESMQERKQKGKDEAGTLTILCDDSSGTSLVLSVMDDGRGIDREAVAKKAGKTVAKNEQELLAQIVTPGLSTRNDVTHTSGRGMGMDIVQKTVDLLGGIFTLKTTPGQGTSFTMKVPVSVTIIDVFSFISQGQTFVAPIAMINEIIETNASQIVKPPVPSQTGSEPRLIQHRGTAIPLFALDALLRQNFSSNHLPAKALIVQHPAGTLAIGVDKMLGQQEVVVRPLNDELFKTPGMAGATDLGDGLPTLVLDLTGLGSTVMTSAEVTL
jgi:two-component system chemotaxis sensor kinase CheA